MKLIALICALAAVSSLNAGDAAGAFLLLLIAGVVLLARHRMVCGERGQPWRLTRRRSGYSH